MHRQKSVSQRHQNSKKLLERLRARFNLSGSDEGMFTGVGDGDSFDMENKDMEDANTAPDKDSDNKPQDSYHALIQERNTLRLRKLELDTSSSDEISSG